MWDSVQQGIEVFDGQERVGAWQRLRGVLGLPAMEALAYELPISVEEYLAGEETSAVRHEYRDGYVRAMSGEKKPHNEIAGGLYAAIRQLLRGGKCRVFIENVKVFPLAGALNLFYYPDVMVACDLRDNDERYCRYPKLLIEVASESTEDKDRGEKLLAYLQNETLEEYVIVAQDRPEASVYRRAGGWARQTLHGFDAVLELKSIGLTLSLREVYEGVLG
jgi:Uma2 family endonuclease